MSRRRNFTSGKALTEEQVILAAINSDHPTVKKAIEKLTFVIEMAHTEDELKDLVDPFVRKIQAVFENDGEYKRYQFIWCGEEFEVINQDGHIITAGTGTAFNHREPVLVYVLDK